MYQIDMPICIPQLTVMYGVQWRNAIRETGHFNDSHCLQSSALVQPLIIIEKQNTQTNIKEAKFTLINTRVH